MGYQALLFCPDEKLARIVAQVFGDLEFNIEPVQEPFSAVKKLMSQRYDALVVDCENESNASLLFKSARNSSSNQGTLAIAVVEGQAGVAKAYRIGANLVLTKPINVEQAKGTLRVARGLLRKNSEVASASAVSPATPAAQTPPPPAASVAPPAAPTAVAVPPVPVRPAAIPPVPQKVARELPEFEPAVPAIAASAVEAPVAAPVQDAPVVSAPSAEIPSPAVNPPAKEILKAIAPVSPAAMTSIATAQGAAVAPAKIKEVAPAVVKPAELQPDPVLEGADSEPVGSTPSFSALDLDKSGNAGGSKKILIAAAVILAVAALGYFGWSKMGSQKASHVAPPAIVPQQAPVPAPPAVATSAPNVPVPVDHSSVTNEPVTPKPSPSPEPPKSAAQAPVRPQVESEPEVKTTKFVAPIQVKSAPANHAKNSSDDSNAPVPNPLAVAEANSNALNSLVSAPTATARPTLATLKISQGVSQGLLIKRVDPKYPPSALAMHVQGAVLLDATISREGTISNVNVIKGDKILAHAAVEAVKQWRYKPYYLDGSPVEIQTQVTINFKLPN